MTEYEASAQEFLTANGITMSVALIGSDCPPFCDDAAKQKDMDKVNTYPRKTHIHGKHYRVTFRRPAWRADTKERWTVEPAFVLDFWNSYADEEFNAILERAPHMGNPSNCDAQTVARYKREGFTPLPWGWKANGKRRQPTAYDVLACITKYDPGAFENFCADFGYDTDSRRAEHTYQAVQKEYRNAARFFTEAELEKLQDIN
jgi:hypothetical protein